ncbi:aldehyde dehydrogenase [Maribacter sp. CXY002]|uniref:aldehyde dehydrogenase n=1 Tax=Maribacter luteocoastalis TaxID=3407671 RepID=UPI003B685F79
MQHINSVLESQRGFFKSQETKNITTRKKALKGLRKIIIEHEDLICDAVYTDFKKPKFETLATETQLVLAELNYAIKNVAVWCKPKRVSSSLVNFPSSDYIYSEPYGNTLIISPWNYPILLTFSPLIGAIAAGNTAVIKPSELTPNTSNLIARLIKKAFPIEYVAVIEGGILESEQLLKEKWDYIFFTGSNRVGKIVYQSAAKHLTPVTLELSGKSPCIVDESANIELAAKRILWGKFVNGGQTCIAPDYILVHHSIKQQFVAECKKTITKFYGNEIALSKDFARIATTDQYVRLKQMLDNEKILFGGSTDDETLYIEPTLLDTPGLDSKVMQDEIFGPILPIIDYHDFNDIDSYINHYDKPLALYIFSKSKKFQDKILKTYSFGGGAINDTLIQISNKKLPFGGVGSSGISSYHGKHSFDIFSHKKSIVKKSNWLDIPFRYAPYNILDTVAKKIKHLF